MRRWQRSLQPIALCLLTAGCSSAPPIALVSPPTPAACRAECEPYPTTPPIESDQLDDWLRWGDDVSADYASCTRLHADCVHALNETRGMKPGAQTAQSPAETLRTPP